MRSRLGFALVAALLALMLIAALAASVFLAAAEETRISAASAWKELALSAAESAIEATIAGWVGNGAEPVGVEGARTSQVDGFGVPVSVTVTRLDSTLYSIVGEARPLPSATSAMRRIAAIVSVQVAADHSIRIDRIGERWWSELL